MSNSNYYLFIINYYYFTTGVGTPGGLCTPDGIFAQNDSLYL